MFSVPAHLGYGALFGLVAAESAGVPVPGETALIAAGLLAGAGKLSLPVVILVAAAAAIIGDNVGYLLGRRGGRTVLLRGRFLGRHRHKALAKGEAFFARHGSKAVFFGRWVPGVRVVAAVLAGASAMPWRRFLVYNALGAFAWSTTVAGLAAILGPMAAATIYGAGVLVAVGAAGAGAVAAWRHRRRTRDQPPRLIGSSSAVHPGDVRSSVNR
jgi:undecaprenyl-diphosphatase